MTLSIRHLISEKAAAAAAEKKGCIFENTTISEL
jgi:hypothetical protein